jgi:DNA-directed RNA polymerase subunit beta|uniref:DNA-directed RNA polymerase subunit beta C-terminal section n=2 Tax=Chlamydomonas reinhardtii TaxID=3055 RepID=RPOB2_CHLRE|nr:RNA polymerase beta subunit II [Chlamydomonas reinhardtii]Q8HTL7.1 RecName: Full=DNA-directed RNA polymerase subunit beta C-terminal section; AltName: Full=PEP; AltName: Full=Plastid-encoded RNA polymerase subunit beta C-terminal section; Short=RNA polymerase subunit beta C-terminal section [Chlamydomonas reinhardtii]AAN41267.1 RNA polymerase beta'' subunit [Chlamydomonas reinhardtii]ACJ50128.1 RNA polymerase beta subunit II [Chlamydomonas reinhardtii]ASF83373.1 RNA polymerase beta subunit I|eukprot:NP_958397.1 RNA polymerase beta subunit II (chloroplast) [Chlamydomonas reinhardtii]
MTYSILTESIYNFKKKSSLDMQFLSPKNFQIENFTKIHDQTLPLKPFKTNRTAVAVVPPLPIFSPELYKRQNKLKKTQNATIFSMGTSAFKNQVKYNLETYHRSNQDTCLIHKPAVKEGDWVEVGDLLADSASSIGGELAIGHNIIVAYMPWEGYNYEDAILINERLVYEDIYTSIHIERYEVTTKETKLGFEQITREIPDISENEIKHLDKTGIAKIGSWVEEGDILVGKITPFNIKTLTPQQKLLYKIFDKQLSTTKDSSLRAPKGIKANVININILARQKIQINTKSKNTGKGSKPPRASKAQNTMVSQPSYIHIYLAEKRKMQVGDKMAGRHGNKGIVSRILPRQDMPFLPDGAAVDIVLNPLGVPSRMNVGQIYECLLGLAGRYLGEHYKIPPFDEMYGADASRSFVLSKLYEARKKTGLKWLLDPNHPGKIRLFDGRNSECFDQTVTVGIAYVLKLVHMVDDKMHARSTGPYSLVTQQPLRGRSKQGGQRLGEMEVWAIEGYGAAFVLSEMLTIKSDDMTGRQNLWKNLIENKEISLGSPESFKVLICELQALCLDIGLFRKNKETSLPYFKMPGEESKTNVNANLTGVQSSKKLEANSQTVKNSSMPNLVEIDNLLNLA